MNDLAYYLRKANTLNDRYAHAVKRVEEESDGLQYAKAAVAHTEEARTLLQGVAEAVQQKAHSKIAGVVTRCLQSVFGEKEAYEFSLLFEQKRGKTEAKPVFIRNGNVLEDPRDESGGGAVDVAALALMVICNSLTKPRRRQLLVLDEPLKGLSPKYRPMVPELLMTLAQDLNIQILLATNYTEFQTGKVIRIGAGEA